MSLLLAHWSLDPGLWFVAVAAVLYVLGAARAPQIPRWRKVSFAAAMVSIVVALASPIDYWVTRWFWVHMLQHELLTMVAAPLAVLGAPIEAARGLLPASLRRTRVTEIRPWVLPTAIMAWVVFVGDFVAWHLPVLYDAALRNPQVHHLEHLLFLATAVWMWWQVIEQPGRPVLGAGIRAIYLAALGITGALLDLVFITAQHPFYHYYASLPRGPHAMSALSDQLTASGVMDLMTTLAVLIAVAIVFVRGSGPTPAGSVETQTPQASDLPVVASQRRASRLPSPQTDPAHV